MAKKVIILGSSGSIGQNAIRLLKDNSDYEIVGLSVCKNANSAIKDAIELGVKHISISDDDVAQKAKNDIPPTLTLHTGEQGLVELCDLEADIVLCAVAGYAGLKPVLRAIDTGKDIALATKEVLVAAGEAVMAKRREKGVKILPVDSEHSAIFQSLQSRAYSPDCVLAKGEEPSEKVINRLILTASGGPFFFKDQINFDTVTVEEALNHPKWTMGKKITIDSATMMNKGLEVIEARWLYNVPPQKIEVLVHPESIVHSIVEFNDLTQIAELSVPDMAFPINFALSYPLRKPHNLNKPLDLAAVGALHFYKPDLERFKLLRLAFQVLETGGTAPAIMNGANEEAVEAFLKRQIRFSDIWKIIEQVLNKVPIQKSVDLDSVFEADTLSRLTVKQLLHT